MIWRGAKPEPMHVHEVSSVPVEQCCSINTFFFNPAEFYRGPLEALTAHPDPEVQVWHVRLMRPSDGSCAYCRSWLGDWEPTKMRCPSAVVPQITTYRVS